MRALAFAILLCTASIAVAVPAASADCAGTFRTDTTQTAVNYALTPSDYELVQNYTKRQAGNESAEDVPTAVQTGSQSNDDTDNSLVYCTAFDWDEAEQTNLPCPYHTTRSVNVFNPPATSVYAVQGSIYTVRACMQA